MKKIVIKRIKLDFNDDRAIVDWQLKDFMLDMENNYPDYEHTIDDSLITITPDYLYVPVRSVLKP